MTEEGVPGTLITVHGTTYGGLLTVHPWGVGYRIEEKSHAYRHTSYGLIPWAQVQQLYWTGPPMVGEPELVRLRKVVALLSGALSEPYDACSQRAANLEERLRRFTDASS